jgi:type IV pilus assembly protein PilC
MTAFQYVAEDARGGRISGVYEDIPDPEHLREDLGKLGYRVLEARRLDGKGAQKKSRVKIRQSEIVAIAYEFSGMFTAGLSVVRCLETMEEQTPNEQMRSILSSVRRSIETGASIAQAFEPYRPIFGDFFMGMLEAGQTGGKLSQTLKTAAEYYEKQLEVRNKVKGAFIYPVVVALLCAVILGAIVIFVIPVFQKLYQQLHIELPLPTQILILISELFRHHFYLFPMLLGAGYWGWKGLRTRPEVRAGLDRLCLRIPVVGPLIQMMLVSRYIRTFAMMSSAGIGVLAALQQARQVCRHSAIDALGQQLEQEIMTGGTLSRPLAQQALFPPVIVQLTHAGEESGLLAEMLTKGADYLDSAIERRTSAILVKLEPLLSVVMGLVVGLILLGVYLPMFDYMSHIK